MKKIAEALNARHGEGTVTVEMRDSYYNMKEALTDHMHCVDHALEAFRAIGVEPRVEPIRGGTDGARLSFEGLPCPNLSTGGENYHSRYEYACVEDMETMTEVLCRLLCAE